MHKIYILRNDVTGNHKIGYSQDPEVRLSQMKGNKDFSLIYVSEFIEYASRIELVAHKNCPNRVFSEWFNCNEVDAVNACDYSLSKFYDGIRMVRLEKPVKYTVHKICKNCGGDIDEEIRSGNRLYCSDECKVKFNKKR